MAGATVLGFIFEQLGINEANIITLYILAVLVISVVTTNRWYSLISSAVSVLTFNFFFTIPKFTLRAYDPDYPVTFLVMFFIETAATFVSFSILCHLSKLSITCIL